MNQKKFQLSLKVEQGQIFGEENAKWNGKGNFHAVFLFHR